MNRDILSEILVRSDHRTLVLFGTSDEYSSAVTDILQYNSFWYDKLEYLLLSIGTKNSLDSYNEEEDYPVLYLHLVYASEEQLLEDRYVQGADHLGSLLLIESVYGSPIHLPSSSREEFWKSVTDPDVLEYALDMNGGYFIADGLGRALIASCERDDEEMVSAIVDKIEDDQENGEGAIPSYKYNHTVGEALHVAVGHGSVRMCRLLSIIMHPSTKYEIIAARARDPAVWSVFSRVFQEHSELTVGELVSKNDVNTVVFLLAQEDEYVHPILTSMTCFENVIKNDCYEMLELLLSLINPAQLSIILGLAATRSVQLFELVLSHPELPAATSQSELVLSVFNNRFSTDVLKNVALTVSNTKADLGSVTRVEQCLTLLTRDVRFRLDKLTTDDIRALCYGLQDRIAPRIRSFTRATNECLLALSHKQENDRNLLGSLLEEEPVSAPLRILRAIVLCDLNPIPLCKWMIESGDQTIYLAARAFVTGTVPGDEEEQVVRALFIFLVHSRVRTSEYILDRAAEGMSEQNILLSVQLGALALGGMYET